VLLLLLFSLLWTYPHFFVCPSLLSIIHRNDDRMLSSVGTGWWRSKNNWKERSI
jgi:hypothetical protein